ncbi:MAG: nucleotidyltransferase domain-containing protein [Candidatus Bathyarchaeia archaeon]
MEKSSSSVRVFYPSCSLEDVVKELKRVSSPLSKRLGLKRIVVFGSYAKNRRTVASDVDVLVVYDGLKSSEDDVYKTLRKSVKLPRVELHILSKEDYELMKDSKWITEIESEGVKIL